jgi:hypothetical protein
MRKGMIATFAIVAVMLTAAWFGRPDRVDAQQAGYEYGYVLPVGRLESFEIDLGRWAGKPGDKEYHTSHVFAYEEGSSDFERRVNSLRRINELAAQGWEMVDAKAGLIRRSR